MSGYKSSISFVCPECRRDASCVIGVPEPRVLADDAIEDQVQESIEISCSRCHTSFDVLVQNSAGSCKISFERYADAQIDASHAFYEDEDEWVDLSVSDDPLDVFESSHSETFDLLVSEEGEGSHLLHRMIFVQQITALEAYLGDTLLKGALGDKEASQRLLENEIELRQKKFTLAEISSDPDLITKTISAHLKNVLYHNLPKVRALYEIVFKFDLFSLMDTKDRLVLLRAIEYRHDCVHRNGRNKDGDALTIFTRSYVGAVLKVLEHLVREIEHKIHPPPTISSVPWLFVDDDDVIPL